MSDIQVFISYARPDAEKARRLYRDLRNAGLRPWLDEESLVPGQEWKPAIQTAIRNSKFFIPLISSNSIGKRGFVQKELREALDVWDKLSRSDIYIIPARLDDSEIRDQQLRKLHYVNLFPDWEKGIQKIIQSIRPRKKTGQFLVIIAAAAVASIVVYFIMYPPPEPSLAPVANAGANQIVKAGTSVTLDGSKSRDLEENGKVTGFSWKQVSGRNVTLSDTDAMQPFFIAPSNYTSDTSMTFALSVIDNNGVRSKNNETVNVKVLKDKPFEANPQIYITNQSTPVAIDLSKSVLTKLANIPLKYAITNRSLYGKIEEFDEITGKLEYIPPAPFSGNDTFTYKATDGKVDSYADITIVVNRVNTPPIANNVSATTIMNKPISIQLSADDKDSAKVTALIINRTSDGVLGEINQTSGLVTYTPNPGFRGTDQFTYKVNDGEQDSNNIGTVRIMIKPNSPPVANNQSVTTSMNQPVNIRLSASDQDNDTLTAVRVSKPSHGQLGAINQTTGIVTYTPSPGFTGTDGFTFKVNDGSVDSSNTAKVGINVK